MKISITIMFVLVYVFLGDHDPMVQFVRCLAKHANISEYAIIHIREFADKFEYTSDTALRRLTNTCKF